MAEGNQALKEANDGLRVINHRSAKAVQARGPLGLHKEFLIFRNPEENAKYLAQDLLKREEI